MAELKNIIFDLGGVLLDVDYNKTFQAFKELGFAHFDKMYNQYEADEMFEKLETGDLDQEAFYEGLRSRHSDHLDAQIIDAAWNSMIQHFRLSSLKYLESLSPKYKLYLLSNTNAIHLKAFSEQFKKETGRDSLDDYFTKAYYSHRVSLRKPNKDIFEFILTDAGIKAEESLFIDDSWNNIETAKAMGFQTALLKPGDRIENLGL